MYPKIATAIICALALTACGSDGDLFQDAAFSFAKTCTTLSASQPEVTYISDVAWPLPAFDGFYFIDTEKIIIRDTHQEAWDLHIHEYIHHLLYKNNGNADACHSSSLFKQCAPSAETSC